MLFARYLGYFKEEGIDAKLVIMSSDIAMKGLLTGDVDFASSVSSVIKAAAIGVPVKTVMNFFNGSFFYFVSKPEFTRIEQLRNKMVAISRYGSATRFRCESYFSPFRARPREGRQASLRWVAVRRASRDYLPGRFDATI